MSRVSVFGFGLLQEKQVLSVNLNRGGEGFLPKLCSHCLCRGVRVGRCVEWTLEPLPEELEVSMVELSVAGMTQYGTGMRR